MAGHVEEESDSANTQQMILTSLLYRVTSCCIDVLILVLYPHMIMHKPPISGYLLLLGNFGV